MPLAEGSSESNLHANIKKLISEGYNRKQAVAIAYEKQREAKEKGDEECEVKVNTTRQAPEGKETGEAFY